MSEDWTGAAITDLRRLWDEGHSAAEIGRRMGRSKNGIIGKAHRLALPSRPSPISNGQVAWDAVADADLRRLWPSEQSPRAIGGQLGRTADAVSKRARVLGLPKRGAFQGFVYRAPIVSVPSHGGNTDRARALRIAHTSPRPPRAVVLAAAPVYSGAPLSGACRWPLWGHHERPAFGEHRFCDGPRSDPRHVYCHTHAAVAYRREDVAA